MTSCEGVNETHVVDLVGVVARCGILRWICTRTDNDATIEVPRAPYISLVGVNFGEPK
jgi:hypothetical protein